MDAKILESGAASGRFGVKIDEILVQEGQKVCGFFKFPKIIDDNNT